MAVRQNGARDDFLDAQHPELCVAGDRGFVARQLDQCSSGTTNPVNVPVTVPTKFYRLFKP
jgi:hypothetical protein